MLGENDVTYVISHCFALMQLTFCQYYNSGLWLGLKQKKKKKRETGMDRDVGWCWAGKQPGMKEWYVETWWETKEEFGKIVCKRRNMDNERRWTRCVRVTDQLTGTFRDSKRNERHVRYFQSSAALESRVRSSIFPELAWERLRDDWRSWFNRSNE